MKILVTGATGFIGNYLTEELLKLGHEVIATGIELKSKLKYKWLDRVTYVRCDLNQAIADPCKYFHAPDMLIHLYWEGLPNYKAQYHFEKNLFNSYFLIKNLIIGGLRNITVLGTCFEYGMKSGMLDEQLESAPVNAYALAKDVLRKFLEELKTAYDFNFKWIRLFYLYGEGQNKDSILEQLKRAVKNKEKIFNMSGGEQLRDYLPIEKAAEYIAKISLQNEITGIINCCSGKPVSIRSFVEKYLEERNLSIKLNLGYYPYPDYEPMNFWGDNSKLMKIIGRG